jgi:hypothetical protein
MFVGYKTYIGCCLHTIFPARKKEEIILYHRRGWNIRERIKMELFIYKSFQFEGY